MLVWICLIFFRDHVLHSDEPCNSTNPKGGCSAQLFAWGRITLCKLLQCCVGCESGCRVGGLSCRGGHKALEEALDTPFLKNELATVQETTHPGVGRLPVVDPIVWSVELARNRTGTCN